MKARLYILAFFEGMMVMAIELIAARLLAPFFGGSLYVITSVLGITMLSLLIGYFLGGQIVAKNAYNKYTLPFLVIAGMLLCLMPILGPIILKTGLALGLVTGAVFTTLFLIGPGLILLGAVSPQIIQQLANQSLKAGTASGNIYAISTLGGVFGTFLVGLYFIPTLGIKMTAILFGIVGALPAILFLFINKKSAPAAILTGLLLGAAGTCYAINIDENIEGRNIIYKSDGLLGMVEVVKMGEDHIALSNNGIMQSYISSSTYESGMPYNHILGTIASLVPPQNRKRAAVIGMAAGSLVGEMRDLNFDKVYAIDIDKRTEVLSEKYFGINPADYTFVEDDGRHFFYKTNEKFDIIIIDVSLGEDQPYHLYTKEAFDLYASKMNTTGLLILNIIDLADKNEAFVTSRIGDGLTEAGFQTRLLKDFYPSDLTMDRVEYYAREKIIIATPGDFVNLSDNYEDMNICCRKHKYPVMLKQNFKDFTYLKKSIVDKPFFDDCPEMETMNFERIKILRTKYLNK